MAYLDFVQLDKDIARAARAERSWLRAVRADATQAASEAWFEPIRYVTTRSTFQQIAELPAGDPLREPMLAWVYRLSLTRIAAAHIVEAARTRQTAAFTIDEPERGTFSARGLVTRLLVETSLERARAWLRALGATAAQVLAAERMLRQAELEIESRLGAADMSLDSPYPRDAMKREATELLARSDDLASSLFGQERDLAAVLSRVLARDVPGVWPTRASARWLFDQFERAELLGGLSLDLGPLPGTLGASSFARALARFGAAYARAAVSSKEMFVLARDPTDAHPRRRGALFASLLSDPIYLKKQLGFSRAAADKAARVLSVTLLAEARVSAARTVLDFALASGSEIHELSEHALKTRISPELSGVLPRPSRLAPVRLCAMLLACDDRAMLHEEFDEDWFRNPRAMFHLRERDEAFRFLRQPKELLEGSAARLALAFEQSLG